MNSRLILFIIILCQPIFLTGQKVENNKSGAEFQSESVSSNGGMNYNMELASVNGDFVSKSIGLSYYGGSGIKVNELSSNVGLGWTISGVDAITRQVNGIPDEGYRRNDVLGISINGEEEEDVGKIFKGWIQQPFYDNASTEDHYLCALGVQDSAPDDYFYTAGAYSGSFHFEHSDTSNINQNNLVVVNHQKNNVLIEAVFEYTQPDGSPCSDYIANCDCGVYLGTNKLCKCDNEYFDPGLPPCCLDGSCDVDYCSSFCCIDTCSEYTNCEDDETDCLNGVESILANIRFIIRTPEGQIFYYGGMSGNKRLEDKSASLSSGVPIDEITINAGVTNTWRIHSIKSTIDQDAAGRDVIQFEYDSYESYAYVDVGSQKYMMKDGSLGNIINDTPNAPAAHLPEHDYFDKYVVQTANQDNDPESDKKNFQNVLYDRASWNVIHYVNALRIKKIKSKYEEIEFEYSSSPRKDVYSGPFVDTDGLPISIEGIQAVNANSNYDYPRSLLGIKQYVRNNPSTSLSLRMQKRYQLQSSYFHNDEGADIYLFPDLDDSETDPIDDAADNIFTVDCNRLILTSISLVENDLTAQDPEAFNTLFYYDLNGFDTGSNGILARRCSLGRDYWGYNNRVTTETSSMIPILPFDTNVNLRPHLSEDDCFSTQDRISRWPAMRAGMLTRIETPSGAKISYTYGANKVQSYPSTHLKQSQNNIVGGVRLERTTVRALDNSVMIDEEFIYEEIVNDQEPNVRQESGKLLFIPTFVELFSPATSMKIHNGNYAGTASNICEDDRTVSIRGMIHSTSITPRVMQSSHIGYSSIIRKVDKGFTETKYFMHSDDELMQSATPTTYTFGVKKYIKPTQDAMIDLALKRGQVKEVKVFDEQTGSSGTTNSLVSSTVNYYNTSSGHKDFVNSHNEYGGMPFQRDYKWSDQFTAKMGVTLNNPINVFFSNLDIPSHCEATRIDKDNTGGQHNPFATVSNQQLFGRVEKSRTSSKVDDVTTTTTYEYKNYNDTISQHRINPIRVLKRIRTFNELDQYEKHVVVYQYAGEDIYNDPSIGDSYQGDSPLVMYRPEADDETAGPNTIKYLKDRHIHSPLGEQLWFTYGEWPNLIAKQVSGTYDLKRIDNDILVSEYTYSYLGNSWNLSTKATEWNSNGVPRKIYTAHLNTTYTDPLQDVINNEDVYYYNPNFEFVDIQNGLIHESYTESPSERLNHLRFDYYDNRLPQGELMLKGDELNEVIYSGSVSTFDRFNRLENQYEGVSSIDASGNAVDYKVRKRLIYNHRGLGDNENSINTTTFFSSQSNLIPITEKSSLDDLNRPIEITKFNNGTNSQLSYLLKTNQYNLRNKIESSYDLGRDTKTIQYEKSPLSRELAIESEQAIDDESVQYSFGGNTANDNISGYVPFTLYKSEITDIDGIRMSTYTDYLQRSVTERRYNDQGNPSDTRKQYDDKGRISRIIPPSGDIYIYTYNDKGLISTKTVPHGGTRKYYYDELLRLVLEIDANGNKMVNVYDDFNRVIQTGLIQRTDFTLPTSTSDYYEVGELELTTADLLLSSMTYHPFTGFLASESLLKMDGNSSPTSNDYLLHLYSSYDEVFGLPTQYAKTNIMGGLDYFELEYNDAGDPIISLHTHQKDTNNPSVRHFQQRTYFDEMNRPWKTYLLFEDDPSQDGQLLSEIEYDEFSRISKKKLHEVATDEFLQEVDFTYDDFGRIIKINDPNTSYDNCDATILCKYRAEISNPSDNFQLGKLYYDQTSFFDLSAISFSSADDLEVIETNIIVEIENLIAVGDGEGPFPTLILDDLNLSIEQLPSGEWQLSIDFFQANYLFNRIDVNSINAELIKTDCCGDNGAIVYDDLYWQELSYLNYIEDPQNPNQTIAVNSTNIHRKDYGYTCGVNKIYQYQYDAFNRLHLARYAEGFMPNTPMIPEIEPDNTGLSGTYSTQINYQNDLGDIGQIFRFGSNYSGTKNGASWDLLDAIDYSYDASNKLFRTTEYGDRLNGHKSINANGQNVYTYDFNGNIISDTGKGFSSMTYTHFNLPRMINHVNNESLEFIYDSKGVQLQKIHSIGTTTQNMKSYCNSIEYTGTSIADSSFEGYYYSDGIIKINAAGEYEFHYFIKDHLGNNVIQFADVDNGGFITPSEIIQENDYYPFGAKILDSGTAPFSADNQYQYNGKEMHRELGLDMYAYGARFYDPFVSRFISLDPLGAEERNWVSQYNYVQNNPINRIDPTGALDCGSPPCDGMFDIYNGQPGYWYDGGKFAPVSVMFQDGPLEGQLLNELIGQNSAVGVFTLNELYNEQTNEGYMADVADDYAFTKGTISKIGKAMGGVALTEKTLETFAKKEAKKYAVAKNDARKTKQLKIKFGNKTIGSGKSRGHYLLSKKMKSVTRKPLGRKGYTALIGTGLLLSVSGYDPDAIRDLGVKLDDDGRSANTQFIAVRKIRSVSSYNIGNAITTYNTVFHIYSIEGNFIGSFPVPHNSLLPQQIPVQSITPQ